MNDFLKELLNQLLPALGQVGIDELKEQLDQLVAEADEPWKKAILTMVGDAVAEYGPGGLQIAVDKINALIDGDPVDLDFTDLEAASDLLAELQNAEADRKSEVNDFLARLSKVLGQILGGLVKGLLSSL